MKIYAVLVLLSMALGGCASTTGIPKKPWNQTEELKSLQSYLTSDIVEKYNSKTLDEKTDYRNAIAYARLRAIDITYGEFVTALAVERNVENIATDTSVLLLSGTAALMTPASTKSILSAISGGIVGIKGSVDKNLFYDKTMPALLAQMDGLRKQRLALILTGLNLKADRYSLTQLLIDLEDYFQAGTIPYAITAVNAQAGAAAQTATNEIKQLKIVSFNYGADESTDKIRAWLYNGKQTIDPERQKELNEWLDVGKVTEDGIPVFLRNAKFKDQRAAFVADKITK